MKLLALALLLLPAISPAQDYPSKLIRIVVPTAPGGGVDGVARVVAQKLQEKWNVSIPVENRAGASGAIGAEQVFRAPPDGYTLLVGTPGALVTNKLLIPKLGYDSDPEPDRDREGKARWPQLMAQFVKRESEVWGNIIRTVGITSD